METMDSYQFRNNRNLRKLYFEDFEDLDDIHVRTMKELQDYVILDNEIEMTDDCPFTNIINFDESKKAWRQNKISRGNHFEYKCGCIKKDGNPCNTPPFYWNKSYMKNEKNIHENVESL